jgi:hypothetical protein
LTMRGRALAPALQALYLAGTELGDAFDTRFRDPHKG